MPATLLAVDGGIGAVGVGRSDVCGRHLRQDKADGADVTGTARRRVGVDQDERQLERRVRVQHPKHAADSLLHGATKGLEKYGAVGHSVHGYLRLPVVVEPGGHLGAVAAAGVHRRALSNSTCGNEVEIAAAGLAEQGRLGWPAGVDGCNLAWPWNVAHVSLKQVERGLLEMSNDVIDHVTGVIVGAEFEVVEHAGKIVAA